jgi:signal transduction histidine kinase
MKINLLILLLLLTVFCKAEIVVDDNFKLQSIANKVKVYDDKEDVWKKDGLQTLLNKQFKNFSGDFFVHRKSSTAIVKFEFSTKDISHKDYVIDIQNPDFDKIQLLLINKKGEMWISDTIGDVYSFEDRIIKYRYFAIPFELKPNEEYTILFALSKPNRIKTGNIFFGNRQEWNETVRNQTAFFSFSFGMFLPFVFFGLILYAFLRQTVYLYYAFYAFFVFLLLFSINGFSYQYLFPNFPAIQYHFLTFAQVLGLLFLNLYAFKFVAFENYFPVLKKVKIILTTLYFITLLSIVFGFELKFAVVLGPAFFYTQVLNFLFLLVLPIYIYFKFKNTNALVFSISFLLVGFSLLYTTLSFTIDSMKYVPLMHSLHVSLFLEMLLLTSYMILTYRNTYLEKLKLEINLNNERLNTQSAFLEGQEVEKRKIAQNLHDNIGSSIGLVKNKLDELEINDKLKVDLSKELSEISKELRNISHEMLPVSLSGVGLVGSLQQLLSKYETKFVIKYHTQDIPADIDSNLTITTQLFRIVQELLKNTDKYAQAKTVYLQLFGNGKYFEIQYEDDGIGFVKNRIQKGIGLNSIELRVQLLKGKIQIESSEDKGILVTIQIPY